MSRSGASHSLVWPVREGLTVRFLQLPCTRRSSPRRQRLLALHHRERFPAVRRAVLPHPRPGRRQQLARRRLDPHDPLPLGAFGLTASTKELSPLTSCPHPHAAHQEERRSPPRSLAVCPGVILSPASVPPRLTLPFPALRSIDVWQQIHDSLRTLSRTAWRNAFPSCPCLYPRPARRQGIA